MTSRLDLARSVADGQEGLLTSAQCRQLGITPAEVARLVRGREWRGIFRGVYLTRPEVISERQRVRAGVLACGEPAVAVLTSAARLHGWPVLPDDPTVQVSLPARRRRLDQPGLAARQLVLADDDVMRLDGIAVTTPARTAADLLPRLPRTDAVAMLDAVLGAGLLTDEHLDAARALVYGNRGAVRARAAMDEADGRAQSPLETRIRLICRDGGVAPEELQFPVHDDVGSLLAVADFGWPSRNVLGEADGRAPHSTPHALLHDRRRQNALLALGFIVVRFTWADTRRPAYIVQTVQRALAAGARSR
ncbi:Transcriptional regulator, AbiEi antitoxin, Type IV TA system [Micromonospora pattaloongensis]|uniref:Transcriptional regulator, AbiEi antitoxin, Type IV TA system n=1 Tax=Micromonospora pattaloongensis TaxID=405436 RepID=A0A1H3HHF1_9ACTN|nr:endonuclease domain-containing protein [Micromonospora pattaloongensis]SDY14214.1 Transcriptional regulator, AbiEi antitoxin, Type IV TA system [Micromonospora pattaloongensis]